MTAIRDVAVDIEDRVDLEDRPFAAEVERYQFLGTLAKGGMGEILLAKDTRIARQVAVKVLKPELRDKREFRSRFLVEARLQGQLEHPAIVPVHDLGERDTGELYFSMKCVRGVTLLEAIEALRSGDENPRFSRRRLLSAFSSVCLAVDFAHSRGVVHRDLKPANVMLGDFGEVYVLDWGIAKLVGESDTPLENAIEIPNAGDASTRVGKVLGTRPFMAPEQLERGVADRRTDVYALGVILDQLLSADKHAIPPELDEIVADATAREPERRVSTTRELHEKIEKYLDGDRDLELRRTQSEEHAQLAEQALARSDENARVDAGREIGRALGLDPSNKRAMQTLMRLLTEVPAQLPAAARAELDRAWYARRRRTPELSTLLSVAMFLYVPFILGMGVRDWRLFGIWLALAICAPISQLIASRSERTLPFAIAIATAFGSVSVLTMSMGITGFVPSALVLIGMSWRMMMRHWVHGLILFAGLAIPLCAPFVLPALGLMSDTYTIQNDSLVISSHLHHFPQAATTVALTLGTAGAIGGALLFGRLYSSEIRRAEERLTFHAWQLQQLLTPQRS